LADAAKQANLPPRIFGQRREEIAPPAAQDPTRVGAGGNGANAGTYTLADGVNVLIPTQWKTHADRRAVSRTGTYPNGEALEKVVATLNGARAAGEAGDGFVFLDIGAGVGLNSIFFAKNGAVRVIAVEDTKGVADALQQNIDKNGLGGKIAINLAVIDHPFGFPRRPRNGDEEPDASANTIDGQDFSVEHIDVIRFGNGYATDSVIDGAKATINRHNPAVIIVEDSSHGGRPFSANEQLVGLGYVETYRGGTAIVYEKSPAPDSAAAVQAEAL
jgi:hypothetical protein